MNTFKHTVLPIFLAGLWVNASEFLRNELLVKQYWLSHFEGMNQVFPSAPVNGIAWMVWGFLFAGLIFAISKRFSLVETTAISWPMGFVLMWIVCWNLNVLPMGILPIAVPLSLLEAFGAAFLSKKFSN